MQGLRDDELACVAPGLETLTKRSRAGLLSFEPKVRPKVEYQRPDWAIDFPVPNFPYAPQFGNGEIMSERGSNGLGSGGLVAAKFDCRLRIAMSWTALAGLTRLDALRPQDQHEMPDS